MPSSDGIAAAFPHKILEKINGTPSRIDIDDAQEKQIENALRLPLWKVVMPHFLSVFLVHRLCRYGMVSR